MGDNLEMKSPRIAVCAILQRSITNEKLAQAGYYDFPAQYESLRNLHLSD
ncbi:hypothetical protein [Paenibacillus sp. ISL-20]|nr:hypothetical protein [Paenibacillus sp. ISL-20]MBT2761294.1 hypothetical protein [Paenibacillus sp. ISL-20]